MVQKTYPDGIIQQAKELFQKGKKHQEIADELGIPRVNTIGEWKKRYKWKRVLDFGDTKEQIVVWDEIAQNARTYLKGTGFTSMKDAIVVYEHALKNIEALKKKVEKKDSKNSVLDMLDDDFEGEADNDSEDESDIEFEGDLEGDFEGDLEGELEIEKESEEETENKPEPEEESETETETEKKEIETTDEN